jgi:hypothetical protein
MKPISVHGAKEGQPFDVRFDDTIQGLHDALTRLIAMGYGGTGVGRADSNGEWCPLGISHLELYDTAEQIVMGNTLHSMMFMLC